MRAIAIKVKLIPALREKFTAVKIFIVQDHSRLPWGLDNKTFNVGNDYCSVVS
jgi:hypothetical protein